MAKSPLHCHPSFSLKSCRKSSRTYTKQPVPNSGITPKNKNALGILDCCSSPLELIFSLVAYSMFRCLCLKPLFRLVTFETNLFRCEFANWDEQEQIAIGSGRVVVDLFQHFNLSADLRKLGIWLFVEFKLLFMCEIRYVYQGVIANE